MTPTSQDLQDATETVERLCHELIAIRARLLTARLRLVLLLRAAGQNAVLEVE